MVTAKLSDMVARLGDHLSNSSAPPADDPDLIARFLTDRDEEAFALLVRRHGPMVLGVCQRITGNHHLAEDAFQAVFIVLARKASSVQPRAALSAWLYGVAYRTALRARTMADRRRRREHSVETPSEAIVTPSDSIEAADIAAVLDEEIAKLPAHLRMPVVLCELEGQTRQQVARKLRIPEGTLSSRLASARKTLAARLRSRGIVLSAGGLTIALGQVAVASVPPSLSARAVASVFTPEAVSPSVAALSHGVLRIMCVHKLKHLVLVIGILVSAGLAYGLVSASDPPDQPRPSKPTATPVGLPKPAAAKATKPAEAQSFVKGPNKILVYRAGHLTMLDPDGKNEQKVTDNRGTLFTSDGKLSPDGKAMAYLIQVEMGIDIPTNRDPRRKLYVRKLDEKEPGTDLDVECQCYAWAPEGDRIAVTDIVVDPDKKLVCVHHLVDVKTKKKTLIKLPDHHVITDWSRDGKYFLTTSMKVDDGKPVAHLYLMKMDGTEFKTLTDGKQVAIMGKLSPDGTRVLYHVLVPPKENQPQRCRELAVLDIATGKSSPVADLPLNGEIQSYCWSPDGKHIAFTWRQVHEGKPEDVTMKETESFLVVSDPDGKNQKTIASEKAQGQWIISIGQVDWR